MVSSGDKIVCINPGRAKMTKGWVYKVINYFEYKNTYGSPHCRTGFIDRFVTLKNDAGWTVKMNLKNFEIV